MNDEFAVEQLEEFLVIDDWSAVYMPYLQDAIEYVINRIQADRWVPVTERLPEAYGEYLITEVDGNVRKDTYNDYFKKFNAEERVVAWKPLPEGYKESKE